MFVFHIRKLGHFANFTIKNTSRVHTFIYIIAPHNYIWLTLKTMHGKQPAKLRDILLLQSNQCKVATTY